MACGSCSCGSGGCGTGTKNIDNLSTKVSGCRSNGTCGTSGCNKLNVFDWLGNMELPSHQRFNTMEIRFKGGRKEFFRNNDNLDLEIGDAVIVDVPNGYHLGYVSLRGELVRLQLLKKRTKDEDIRDIYRKASSRDLERFSEVQTKEMATMYRAREIIQETKLQMKLSDVEYQADNTKATFYYSADDRVDFRELIKVLASEFKVRIEMRQISLRQEASRLGGIGVCGRELCCSTWLTEFKSVSTAAARYQNLSLNPSKLSGQCGRLKCCLNYELETYLDALVDIPKVEKPIMTTRGDAHLQKTDIFKKIMWFSYDTESTWYPLSTARVKEILAINEKGTPIENLTEDNQPPKVVEKEKNKDFQQNLELENPEKLDERDRNRRRKSSNNRNERGRNDQGRNNDRVRNDSNRNNSNRNNRNDQRNPNNSNNNNANPRTNAKRPDAHKRGKPPIDDNNKPK
ncbi:MAG: Signal peptidase-like protein [Cytophagales bacterium]|nr:MAG: Signal peptidase-like protein [Cytophagales bacterium]